MSVPNIRVLVVDDHPVVLNGLGMMVRYAPDMDLVGEARNGQEAIALYREHQPDVTLMDVRLPEMSGVETIQRLRQEFSNARILILSTYDHDEDIYSGLQSGAMGYLLKDTPLEIIRDAIRKVHRGQKYIPTDIAAKLAEHLTAPKLSDREKEVLLLIAQGKSNAEIGESLHISENTTKFHVNNILLKLGVSDRTHAAVTAIQQGIIKPHDLP